MANPLENTYSNQPQAISSKTFHIAGIVTTIYGLEEVLPSHKSISCLWLLHPRLQTKQTMEPVAFSCLSEWKNLHSSGNTGLIAVAFDQRNHGSREVDPPANGAWRDGNETHAQDMFSVFQGTALDTSLLIDHIGSYIFHGPDSPSIEQHLVLGVSLGGHAAWQLMFNDPRITAGVIIIGCPDYMCVMTDRARLSKRKTYTSDSGATFLGSTDFPKALVSSIQARDPKGILFSTSEIPSNLSEVEQRRLRPILDSRIKGKRFLICSGGADKLVPYRCSEPFLRAFKEAANGWYKDGNIIVDDRVYEGEGHVFSPAMLKDALKFINDSVVGVSSGGKAKI